MNEVTTVTFAVCVIAALAAGIVVAIGGVGTPVDPAGYRRWSAPVTIAIAIFVALIIFAGGPALWGTR